MAYGTVIGAAAARNLIEGGQAAVFDCSFDLADQAAGRRLFGEAHLPGAHYLHLDDDLSGPPSGANGRHPLPDPDVFAGSLRAAGLSLGMQVIAYDNAGGAYAARLWWLLRWIGHDAVAVLDGGVAAWRAAGGTMAAGDAVAVADGDFVAMAPDADRIVDAQAVLANIGRPQFQVVDARAAERFTGEAKAFDPVPGHIPGARNRPFKDNLGADGLFKPGALLAAEFAAVTGGAAPDTIVLQCGSGVTACHNALALEIAGLGGARLYPGSWSEWIADPSRPVALGE